MKFSTVYTSVDLVNQFPATFDTLINDPDAGWMNKFSPGISGSLFLGGTSDFYGGTVSSVVSGSKIIPNTSKNSTCYVSKSLSGKVEVYWDRTTAVSPLGWFQHNMGFIPTVTGVYRFRASGSVKSYVNTNNSVVLGYFGYPQGLYANKFIAGSNHNTQTQVTSVNQQFSADEYIQVTSGTAVTSVYFLQSPDNILQFEWDTFQFDYVLVNNYSGTGQNSANLKGVYTNSRAHLSGSMTVDGYALQPYELWHSGGSPIVIGSGSFQTSISSDCSGLCYCPSNDLLYVGDASVPAVKTVTADGTTTGVSLAVSNYPNSIVYVPTANAVYAMCNSAGIIYKINCTAHSISSFKTLAANDGYYSCYCPSTDRLFVPAYGTGAFISINPHDATSTNIPIVVAEVRAYCCCYCPTSDRVYATNYFDSLFIINPHTNTIETTISGISGLRMCYCPLNNRMYILRGAGNKTISIDCKTLKLQDENIPYSQGGSDIQFNPSNGYLYWSSNDVVYVYNPLTKTVITRLTPAPNQLTDFCYIESRKYMALCERNNGKIGYLS